MSDNDLRISETPNGLVIGGERKDASSLVMSQATGEWGTGKYTGGRRTPTQDEIAEQAFSLYELRGRQDGHHLEDWLHAEQQLVKHYA